MIHIHVEGAPRELIAQYVRVLAEAAAQTGVETATRYLNLGTHVVRLLCRAPGYLPFIESSFACVLQDSAAHFDATVIMWEESNFRDITKAMDERCDAGSNPRLRIELLARRMRSPTFTVSSSTSTQHNPIINIDGKNGIITACNLAKKIWYYALPGGLEHPVTPHDGNHILASIIKQITDSSSTVMVHGAVVGLNGHGALVCGYSGKGKSTLAMRALLDDFQYVADDYAILSRESGALYAWPIYSIAKLSDWAYGQMQKVLSACEIITETDRDEYVISLESKLGSIVRRYPIRLALTLERSPNGKAQIAPCSELETERAIEEAAYSSSICLKVGNSRAFMSKVAEFARKLLFFKFQLSQDLEENQHVLREFMSTRNS